MKSRDNLLPEPTCAFLRHAFGCFYDAFSQIDLANRPFIHTLVFHETLLSFRSAVLSATPTRSDSSTSKGASTCTPYSSLRSPPLKA